jgi:hypothetical protein
MANLNDLPIKSIADMEREELITHILSIRKARRYVGKTTTKKSSAPTKRTPAEKKPKDIIGMLSPEQAAALLEQLED